MVMKNRTKNRASALQILFALDYFENYDETDLENLYYTIEDKPKDDEYCKSIVDGVLQNLDKIDEILGSFSQHWKLHRISGIDKNILRIAIYEMTFREDIPYKVAIDEACELSKIFGDCGSSSFVNGILDKVHKKHKK